MAQNGTKYKKLTDAEWEAVRWKFENTKTSYRALAKEFGVSHMTISRRAEAESWSKFDRKAVKTGVVVEMPSDLKAVTGHRNILTEIGIRKVKELIEELGDNYSPIDEPLIVAYALEYQRMIKLEKMVQEQGETIQSVKTGALYMNPTFSALQSVKSNLAKLGDRFGASVASRKRVGITLNSKEKDATQSLFELIEQSARNTNIDV